MCFALPQIWQTIEITDDWPPLDAATMKNVTNENCYEYSKRSLDYERATNCLERIGHLVRNIYVRPSQNFVKLYQFFVLFKWYFVSQVTFRL